MTRVLDPRAVVSSQVELIVSQLPNDSTSAEFQNSISELHALAQSSYERVYEEAIYGLVSVLLESDRGQESYRHALLETIKGCALAPGATTSSIGRAGERYTASGARGAADAFVGVGERQKYPFEISLLIALVCCESASVKLAQAARVQVQKLMHDSLIPEDRGNERVDNRILEQVLVLLHRLWSTFGLDSEKWTQLIAFYYDTSASQDRQPLWYVQHLMNQPPNKTLSMDFKEMSLSEGTQRSMFGEVLKDTGASVMSSPEVFDQFLDEVKPFSATAVAHALGVMAKYPDGVPNSISWQPGMQNGGDASGSAETVNTQPAAWDLDVFTHGINRAAPQMNWNQVIKALDYPDLVVNGDEGFRIIEHIYQLATGAQSLPLGLLLGEWKLRDSQIAILRPLAQSKQPRVTKDLDLNEEQLQRLFPGGPNWISKDLIERFLTLARRGSDIAVRQILLEALDTSPEALLIGMGMSDPTISPKTYDEIWQVLIRHFIHHHTSAMALWRMLWEKKQPMVLLSMVRYYNESDDTNKAQRVMQLAGELKATDRLLSLSAYPMVFDLALLRGQGDMRYFQQWLSSRKNLAVEDGSINDFVTVLLRFATSKANQQKLPVDAASIIIENLKSAAPSCNQSQVTKIRETFVNLAKLMPQLANIVQSMHPRASTDDGSLQGGQFPDDVEKETHSMFESLFNQKLSVQDFISTAADLKADPNRNQVFMCLVHNLFDESKYFNDYPEKQLMITAEVFGGLINAGLFGRTMLQFALPYLEKCMESGFPKLVAFADLAIERFKDRLPEMQSFAQRICSTKGFSQMPQAKQRTLQAAARGESPQSSGTGRVGLSGATNSSLIAAAELSQNYVPDEELEEQIRFVFNNLSEINMQDKVAEAKKLITPQYLPWFAQYLVIKRACLEPNFHPQFIQFLEEWDEEELWKKLYESTIKYVKIMMLSDAIIEKSSERTILKNLGMWLGLITLRRNKPIFHKDLSLKDLMLDAYNMARQAGKEDGAKSPLIFVVPLVCKVLEGCRESRIFTDRSPYINSILRVLKDLHNTGIKMTLKFEIEVMCKNIAVNLDEILPGNLLGKQVPKTILHGPAAEATTEQQNVARGPVIPSSLVLFQQYPNLRNFVAPAIEQAVSEQSGLLQRTSTIVSVTVYELVVKDFMMDGDETKLAKAAHHAAVYLSSNWISATARDFVRNAIANNLKHSVLDQLLNGNIAQQIGPEVQAVVENAANVVADENVTLATSILEQAAIERTLADVDEKLAQEYEIRIRYRERGQRYMQNPTYSLPPILRQYKQSIGPEQMRVYDVLGGATAEAAFDESKIGMSANYSANGSPTQIGAAGMGTGPQGIMGSQSHGQPSAQAVQQSSAPQGQQPTGGQEVAGSPYPEQVFNAINMFFTEAQKLLPMVQSLSQPNAEIQTLFQQLSYIMGHMDDTMGYTFAQEILKLLYKSGSDVEREFYAAILRKLRDKHKRVARDVTYWVIGDGVPNFPFEAMSFLIKYVIVNTPEVDSRLADELDGGRNAKALQYAMNLITACLLEEKITHLTAADFLNTLQILDNLAAKTTAKQAPGLHSFLNTLNREQRQLEIEITNPNMDTIDAVKAKNCKEIFNEFLNHAVIGERAYAILTKNLQQKGLLGAEGIDAHYFRVTCEIAVEAYYTIMYGSTRQNNAGIPSTEMRYSVVDAWSKMVVLLVRFLGDNSNMGNQNIKIKTVAQALQSLVSVITQDVKKREVNFNQKPYYRILRSLVKELNAADAVLEAINFQALNLFSIVFHRVLAPQHMPGFAFAWLDLISQRTFMVKLLLIKSQKGWPLFHTHLIDLFTFLGPFLRRADMNRATRKLYKGTVRVLLVLLHDFPEFLCDYHFSLCDVIPQTCIQLRNLILSAFPRNMRLPDPFGQNLKVDLLPEIQQAPRILGKNPMILQNSGLKPDLDSYLRDRQPSTFLGSLKSQLLLQDTNEAINRGTKYDVPLINSLVLHVGMSGIANMKGQPLTNTTAMDIFKHLVHDLDAEGRYHFLNAMTNQLRYPNSHTHYFSCILLYLFSDSEPMIIREQITRILLERLIVNRPHPWGILITFIELIKNPRYRFWEHSFVKIAPELEKLFESVGQSCMPTKA
eukprot:Clim_evm82s88 gene=Clim_evmTU82s88